MAVCFVLSAIFTLMPDKLTTASAAGTSVTVTVKDLMERHGVDYAIGPLDGKRYNAAGVETANGEYNNPYGIANTNYFDASKYLYTTNADSDDYNASGTVLRGWRNGIQGLSPVNNIVINTDGSSSSGTGPYIYYAGTSTIYTCKYVIIVPDNITTIGLSNNGYDITHNTSSSTTSKFTDFGFYHYSLNEATYPNHWQPRERLGGLYFTNNSNLTTIESGTASAKSNSAKTAGSTYTYPAFAKCDNMRFCVLPNNGNLKTIGNYGFARCSQMREVNIPSSVETLGNYSFNNTGLVHITIPSTLTSSGLGTDVFSECPKLRDVEDNSKLFADNFTAFSGIMNYYQTDDENTANYGNSSLYVIGTSPNENGQYVAKNAFYYCYNKLKTSTLADTIKYSINKWYCIGLAGAEDKSRTTIYNLPQSVSADIKNGDTSVLDERRTDILYDFLNSDGSGYKNSLGTVISEYDIAASACKDTWLGNIIIPEGVKIIGDNAFNYCHMQYVELPSTITRLGKQAFYDNMQWGSTQAFANKQYYYFHGSGFAYSGTDTFTWQYEDTNCYRCYIFENQSIYNALQGNNNLLGTKRTNKYYQIPVKAQVVSEDGNVELEGSDMSTLFAHDLDSINGNGVGGYITSPSGNGNGTYTITYTKRLNGQDFDFIKQSNGSWLKSSVTAVPNIVGNDSTQWYSASTCNDDQKISSALSVYGNDANDANFANKNVIYTKKLGAPTVTPQTWVYGEKTNVSFDAALTLSSDYKAEFVSYTKKNGDPETRTVVEDAGDYVLRVQLADKWGKWATDKKYYQTTYTVDIERQPVDLGDPNKLPTFVDSESNTALGGTGEGATLRRYQDGWYLYEQLNEELLRSVTVLNSFVRFRGDDNPITIVLAPGSNVYTLDATQTKDNTKAESGEYFASFTIDLPNSYNYIFTEESKDNNRDILNLYGISSKILNDGQTATLTKTWYIVTQGNWFVDSSVTADDDKTLMSSSFNLTTKTEDGKVIPTTTWSYEDTNIDLHFPRLAYGNTAENLSRIKFTLTYTEGGKTASIVGGDGLPMADLEKYINSSMPAGEYTVLINAPAVDTGSASYPEINERITLTVNPKEFSEDELGAVQDKLTNKIFEKASNGKLFLYNAGEESDSNSIISKLNALQNTLNNYVNTGAASRAVVNENYWTEKFDDYYSNLVITFNLDRMQTRQYYTEAEMKDMNSSRVPIEPGEYIVYYSLSARNYKTLGGEQADDAERRQLFFTVVIYKEIRTNIVISDVVYAGKDDNGNKVAVYPSVPYSTDYKYEFDDENGYKDAGEYYVTLTMENPKLARWVRVDGDKVGTATQTHSYETDDHVETIQIKFNITKANNGWQSAPQISDWSYNGFDVNTYKITSTQNFRNDNLTAYYRIGYTVTDDEDRTTTVWVNLGNIGEYGVTLDSGDYFKLDDNGLIPKVVADQLNLLKPGNYFLASAIEGDDNIRPFTTGEGNYNNIHISIAANTWVTPPNIIPWIWGRYNSTLNTVSAQAVYPVAGGDYGKDSEGNKIFPEIHFAVLYSDRTAVSGLEDFTSVGTSQAAILGALPVGTYYLKTTLAGTDYFTALTPEPTPFYVYQATNTWSTPPGVTAWKWSEYDRNTNKILAVPQYSSANDGTYGGPVEQAPKVKYTVLVQDKNKNYVPAATALVNFESDNGVVNATVGAALFALPAGDYRLVTSMDERNNYSALNSDAVGYDFSNNTKNAILAAAGLPFTVSPITNTWNTEPNMTGWDYNGFNATANFIAGEAHFKVDGQKINYSVYNADKSVNILFTEIDSAVTDKLSALSAGDYTFSAEYGGTDNFAKATKTGTFRVTPAENNPWSVTPSVSDWVYKNFDADNITAGTDSFGSEILYTVERQIRQNQYESIEGYSSLDFDALVEKLNDKTDACLGADIYRLTATSVASANHGLATISLIFNIEKAKNEWAEGKEPTISGWTFGDTAASPNEAQVRYENGKFDITGLYYRVERDGTEWKISSTGSAVKPTAAGNYAYITSAAVKSGIKANYSNLEYTAYFTISQAENRWTSDEAESTLTWVYGNASSNISSSKLANLTSYKGEVSYVVRAEGSNSDSLDKDGLISYFTSTERAVGTYSVVATVAGTDDYSGLTATTSITINKAAFAWKNGTEPAISRTWVWGCDASEKTFVAPEVEGRQVVYKVSYSSATSSSERTFNTVVDGKTTAQQLVEYLFGDRSAGTYTVTATLEDPNYNSLTGTTELTITQASNEWEENEPVSAISAAYSGFAAQPVPVPKYGKGTVVYTDNSNGARINDLRAWLNGLSYGTMHSFTTSVAETGNYAGLSSVTTVTVNQIAVNWTNASDLKNSYEPFSWSDSLDLGTVVIPYINGGESRYVSYTVDFKSVSGSSVSNTYRYVEGAAKSAQQFVREFLDGAAARGAGTYTLTATYNRGSNNYNTLTYNLTIVVNRQAREWIENIPENLVTSAYKAVDIAVPVASGDNGEEVAISVTSSTGSTTPGNLGEYLNNLSAGTYTIKFTVAATTNYGELTAQTTLVISTTANSWNAGTAPAVNISITRGHTGDVMVVPEAKYGNSTLRITITKADGTTETPSAESLNSRLNNLPAGTNTVMFTVIGTDDYTGLTAQTRIVVSKMKNNWKKDKAPATSYSWIWSETGYDFSIPEAEHGTVSYSIVDLTPSGTHNSNNLNESDFLNTLKNLPVGVYRVVSEIVYNAADDADYDALSGDTSVSISKVVDGWTRAPQATLEWLWHDTEHNEAFVPAEASGTVTFSVRKRNGTATEQISADDIEDYLLTLDSGTYSVIATVGDGETSELLQGVTVLTINHIETVWTNASSLLTERVNWTIDGENNETVIAPVSSWGNVTIMVDNSVVQPKAGKTMTEVLNEYLASSCIAGTYTITASVTGDNNHTDLSYSIIITINKATNEWKVQPNKNVAWTYGANNNATVAFEPKYNNIITYFSIFIDGDQISDVKTVNGVQVPDLATALSRLNAGTHAVRAEVEETDNYLGLNASVTLTIAKSNNGWKDGNVEIGSWTWDNYQVAADKRVQVNDWKVPVPLYGNSVNITVYSGAYEEIVVTLNYNKGVVSDVEEQSLLARIRTLNAGTYRIHAEIPESTNYKPYTASADVTFVVGVASNSWTTDPAISDWVYGNDASLPTAVPRYGSQDDVRYTYYRITTGGKQLVTVLDKAGNYEFEAYLPASPDGNYNALTSERVPFKINKAELPGWQTTPNITPWIWDAFEAKNNLFLAAASTGGEAKFTIYAKDEEGNKVEIPYLSGFKPNDVGVITSQNVINALKGLKAGTYYYTVTVAEVENYTGFSLPEQTLTIDTASNDWIEYPTIKGWAEYFPGNILPTAKAKYGDITIVITSDTEMEDGQPKIYLEAVYYADGTKSITYNDLKSATAGLYTLSAYVPASEGEYSYLSGSLPVEVFVGSYDRPVNHWTVLPAMDNWTWGDEHSATPRGEAYWCTRIIYTYWKAEQMGSTYVKTERLGNDCPVNPGTYIVNMVVVHDGYELIDRLEAEVRFTIFTRTNEWKVTPNMPNYSLGEGTGTPVAELLFDTDAEIKYQYKYKNQIDETAWDGIPTTPGEYTMIVTATAANCEPLVAYVDFTVAYSKNSWLDIPVIKDWSEEFEASNPTGVALFGDIVYTYSKADGTPLKEKPHEEGSYIMYATVKLDGYETLSAEYSFTITAAYDRTLLTIDIILAFVVSAVTVVVIVFAIRRYKENG